MEIVTVDRPDFEAPNEGAQRTATFSWLLEEVVPRGGTMLDLGAGPCVFARRAVNAGYRVTAVDGRTDRVPEDLPDEIEFVQSDVRNFEVGGFDVVTILGLLYHLTLSHQLALLRACVSATVIVDTQIHDPGLVTDAAGDWARRPVQEDGYDGVLFQEGDNPMASIGNEQSFWHTEPSLLRLFEAAGFSACTVVEPVYVSKYGARKFYVLR